MVTTGDQKRYSNTALREGKGKGLQMTVKAISTTLVDI